MPRAQDPIRKKVVKKKAAPLVVAPGAKFNPKTNSATAPKTPPAFKNLLARPDKGIAKKRAAPKEKHHGFLHDVGQVAEDAGKVLLKGARDAAPPGIKNALPVVKPTVKVGVAGLKQLDSNKIGGKAISIAAASNPTFRSPVIKTAANVGNRWRNAAIVAAENPQVRSRLPMDLLKAGAQTPAGIYGAVTGPKKTAQMVAKDYKHRYSGKQTDEQQRAEMKKTGVLPEVLDASTVATAAVGGSSAAAQKLAAAGKLGKTAEKIATERPKLQIGGQAVDQSLSSSFVRNAARHGTDLARKRKVVRAVDKHEKRVAEHGPDAAGLHPEIAAARDSGAVVPLSQRMADRKIRRTYAEVHARAQSRGRIDILQTTDIAAKELKRGLNKDEQLGFYYASKYGIKNSKQARELLANEIGRIEAARAKNPAEFARLDIGKTDAVAELKRIVAEPEKFLTKNSLAAARNHQRKAVVLGRLDPTLKESDRRMRAMLPQAQALGVVRKEGETHAAFIARAKHARKQAGLAEAGYVPSKILDRQKFLPYTTGRGKFARKGDKRYTGVADTYGLASSNVDGVIRGLVSHVSRSHNWQMVADVYDRLAYKKYRGKSLREQIFNAERDGLDLSKVVFVNPGVMKKSLRAAHEAQSEAGRFDPTSSIDMVALDKVIAQKFADSSARIDLGAMSATERIAALSRVGKDKNWVMIPRELDDQFTGFGSTSGKAGRGFDIAKGKASRVLLANPAWLQFQIGANALLTGLSGTGPVSLMRAQKWWHDLSEQEKRAVEPYIGAHRWYDVQPHLGSAGGGIAQAWGALKETPVWQKAHRANPLDAIFKVDNAQNNFFRRAVFYNRARREAYARMNASAGKIINAQERMATWFDMDPQQKIAQILQEPQTIERLAKDVNDFLGDYMTYTPKERATLGRAVMFYGFMRFAVKFTFYTMPIQHPLMTMMITQLGRMERDELEKIFGGDVPPWNAADFFRDGKKVSISRMSPYFPTMEYLENSADAAGLTLKLTPVVGMLPPIAQEALGQILAENVGTGKKWNLDGSGSRGGPVGSGVLDGLKRRFMVALADLAPTYIFGYRQAAQGSIPGLNQIIPPNYGKQGSDSSLFFREPTIYKTVDKNGKRSGPGVKGKQRNDELIAEQRRAVESGQKFKGLVAPLFFPEPSAPDLKRNQIYQDSKRKKKGGGSSEGGLSWSSGKGTPSPADAASGLTWSGK